MKKIRVKLILVCLLLLVLVFSGCAKDTTPPRFEGVKDQTIEYGKSFDPIKGVKAISNRDIDLTKRIKVSSEIDSYVAGQYQVLYEVSDSFGNANYAIATITVESKIIPPQNYSTSTSKYSSSSSSSGSSSELKSGEYWCMGKNDTCKNKTYSAYDLFCSSCDKDNDNIED